MVPRLVRDPLTGAQVILAPGRAARPGAFSAPVTLPDDGECPFCAGRESQTPPEVLAIRSQASRANDSDWTVRVVPNRFPAVATSGMGIAGAACGVHEVIVETPHHDQRLVDLDADAMAALVSVYFQRLRDISIMPGISRALVFKNCGANAGASLVHEHAQAIGLNMVPPLLGAEERRCGRYQERTGRCLVCELVEHARRSGRRIIFDSAHGCAFCPPAPRYAHETWFVPQGHGYPSATVCMSLAVGLLQVLRGLVRLVPGAAYNLVLAGPAQNRAESHHFVLKLLPRLTGIAGLECGGGLHVNPVPPVLSARLLRENSKQS
jgi:UDPglucose--hexose-1-phosphate uridylyltransferase